MGYSALRYFVDYGFIKGNQLAKQAMNQALIYPSGGGVQPWLISHWLLPNKKNTLGRREEQARTFMVVFSLGSFLVAAGVVFVRDTLGVWEMPGVVWWKYFYTSLPYILSCLPWLALVKVISKMYEWSGGRWGIQVEELFFCFSDAISDRQAAIVTFFGICNATRNRL